jgi:hypothetical protein
MRKTELRELKRLLDALRQAGSRQYKTQLRYVHEILENTQRFRSILGLLKASTTAFEADAWMQTKVLDAKPTCHEWPPTEAEKLRLLLRMIEVCATHDKCEPTSVGRTFTYEKSMDRWAQAFTEHVVDPLVGYLVSRLSTESELLHQLERMRRQVEWFEQQELYDQFTSNTSKGEKAYDDRVREFLFAEGIDYPFSQPASVSGRADVVAGLDGDDPLVCEIKLYDGDDYGIAYIKKGVTQAVRYARDYGKSAAYLVVFNLSDERLQVPSDSEPDEEPVRLQIEGVTVFVIVVQAKPVPSASRDFRRHVREVKREHLLPNVAESTER